LENLNWNFRIDLTVGVSEEESTRRIEVWAQQVRLVGDLAI
jgi:hypothetical protein